MAIAFCDYGRPDTIVGACRTLGECWGHDCVGFADCPCGRCRGLRIAATAAHPDHGANVLGERLAFVSECATCRTQAVAS